MKRVACGGPTLLIVLAAVAPARAAEPAAAPSASRPVRYNVLLIIVDDLAVRLGCYGDAAARTPNLDRLAGQGRLFRRAYCQWPVCNPSRASFMTGRRPDTTRIFDNQTPFRTTLPGVATLPQWFKQHGYHTLSLSKVYHREVKDDDPPSWSEPAWHPQVPVYASSQANALRSERMKGSVGERRGPAWEEAEIADEKLPDGATAEKAVEALRANKDRLFFMAVGFARPHLPFVAPKKYWAMHPPEAIRVVASSAPAGAPSWAVPVGHEMRAYVGVPSSGPIVDGPARDLTRAYYACVSYVDARIGRVLDELDRLGLTERTIVVVVSDQGYHLGEQGAWGKSTCYDAALRSMMIVRAPGMSRAGAASEALVELVDLYPTLCDLSGLPTPRGLEGVSLRPVLENPSRPFKKAAFSECHEDVPGVGRAIGRTLRTERYRLTEWTLTPRTQRGLELYDYAADPSERVNLALKPEYAELVKTLTDELHAGWRAARPQ